MDDAVFIDLMTDLWGGADPNADLWEVALLDDDPEPEVIDPRVEERCLRDAAEGDLLAPPPFDDVEVPGSLLSETEALADRRDPKHYPFPVDIDPDEEKPW